VATASAGHFLKIVRSGAPPAVSLDIKKTNPRHISSLKWGTRRAHLPRIHGRLRITPAMEAGIVDRVMELNDLVTGAI
jgi:hypothetical protein